MASGRSDSVTVSQERNQTRIVVIGNTTELPMELEVAIWNEGWHWSQSSDSEAFLSTPQYPRIAVLLIIETFTITSLDLVHNLAVVLGLPVIVFGFEQHPMIVRAALEAGAEDFIPIPTSVDEILARLRAIIRVRFRDEETAGDPNAYHFDETEHRVHLACEGIVELSLSEYRLFKALLAAANQPVRREHLTTLLAPFARSHSSNVVDLTVSRLRRKLGTSRIRTIRGVGYQLVDYG